VWDVPSDLLFSLLYCAGSRFLVPVAGFLCRLCNKFYHFESAALHSHCKSLTHFEHLKVGVNKLLILMAITFLVDFRKAI